MARQKRVAAAAASPAARSSSADFKVNAAGRMEFVCPRCSLQLARYEGLRRHVAQCGKPPRLQCPYCAYLCHRSDNLRVHVRKVHKVMVV